MAEIGLAICQRGKTPIMKRCVFALLLLVLTARPLFATAQFPEILILEGKEEEMVSTPLDEYFKAQPQARPHIIKGMTSTALFRGYRGTWEIKNGDLLLKSVQRHGLIREGQESRSAMVEVPLKSLFPTEDGPVKATWFSGVLALRRGELLQTFMGLGSIYSQTTYLTIKDGKLIARHEIDNETYGATRSVTDFEFVFQAGQPVADSGEWIDARDIPELRSKAEFTTRGLFFPAEGDHPPTLVIPVTPTTGRFSIRLDLPRSLALPAKYAPIEVAATRSGKSALRVIRLRPLTPGETIHHPGFQVK